MKRKKGKERAPDPPGHETSDGDDISAKHQRTYTSSDSETSEVDSEEEDVIMDDESDVEPGPSRQVLCTACPPMRRLDFNM